MLGDLELNLEHMYCNCLPGLAADKVDLKVICFAWLVIQPPDD